MAAAPGCDMGKYKALSMWAFAWAVMIMTGTSVMISAAAEVRHGHSTKSTSEDVLAVWPRLMVRELKALKETKGAKARTPPCTRGPFTLNGGNKLWNEWRAYNGKPLSTYTESLHVMTWLINDFCRRG